LNGDYNQMSRQQEAIIFSDTSKNSFELLCWGLIFACLFRQDGTCLYDSCYSSAII